MADICRYALLHSFAEHRQALTRFLTCRLGNPALAADLTHETWLRAARRPAGAPLGNPRSHLFRIASNLAVDHQHRVDRANEGATPEGGPSGVGSRRLPGNVLLHRSELARVARVIDGLPPRSREIFLLFRFDGLSHEDIAERLGTSRSTVVNHVVNAMAAIECEMDVPR